MSDPAEGGSVDTNRSHPVNFKIDGLARLSQIHRKGTPSGHYQKVCGNHFGISTCLTPLFPDPPPRETRPQGQVGRGGHTHRGGHVNNGINVNRGGGMIGGGVNTPSVIPGMMGGMGMPNMGMGMPMGMGMGNINMAAAMANMANMNGMGMGAGNFGRGGFAGRGVSPQGPRGGMMGGGRGAMMGGMGTNF